tara:strand:+ start:101078 stop:101275 length:198 start_codon:yes stop_codon:yes gene_type:complete
MSNNKKTFRISGMLIFLIFLVLKLTHVIDWSWWWVTSPLWIGFGLMFLTLIFVAVIGGIMLILKK